MGPGCAWPWSCVVRASSVCRTRWPLLGTCPRAVVVAGGVPLARWPLPRQERWARSTSYPFGAPRWSCPWRVPSASVLGCVRCGGLACVDLVTDASGFTYSPFFSGGLSRYTGADPCGRPHLPFRVGGGHARVPRACAGACSSWPGQAGRSPGRVLVHLTFPLAVLSFCVVRPLPCLTCGT